MVRERAVVFGKGATLVGVVTEPEPESRDLPAVLLWNAGLIHRVGPFRLFVDLARGLATRGFTTLRFDVSGRGDSELPKEAVSEEERTSRDIEEAMNFLAEKKGISAFVLIGSCSGADEAFPVAVRDTRVVGLVLLDGFGYRTLGYYVHHYGPRLFKADVWARFFKRTAGTCLELLEGGRTSSKGQTAIFVRKFPPKKAAEAALRGLTERGVRLLFVYSGGVAHFYYNYPNQFRDMFRSLRVGDAVQTRHFPDAGHTYPEVGPRIRLIDTISEWMAQGFLAHEHPGHTERT